MHLYDLGHDNDPQDADEIDNDYYDDPDPNYCDDIVKKKEYEDHYWFEDRNNLSNLTDEKIEKVSSWIEKMKEKYNIERENDDINTLKKEELKFKQRIAYYLIEEWFDKKSFT